MYFDLNFLIKIYFLFKFLIICYKHDLVRDEEEGQMATIQDGKGEDFMMNGLLVYVLLHASVIFVTVFISNY